MANHKPSRRKNLSITALVALTGFVSLAVIIGALLLGLWIDGLMGQRGPATVCMLIASVPVSLFLMMKIALGLVSRIQPQPLVKSETTYPQQEKED